MAASLLDEIRNLRADNDALRAEVAYLRELLSPPLRTPPAWGLARQEEIVTLALILRPLISRDALIAAIYTTHGKDEPAEKTIDVLIWKTRRKLAAQGAHVGNQPGRGWFLADGDRARLRAELLPASVPEVD
ncbi:MULTISPECIES: helix-turn-helix domain-containing protein [unclassified Xanthobacter]|uniref:helix-turn-helix domain-containing protein n=1 Tax=unclassified Xanthobacter TaxID=2623496 RepID=UPI001EE0713E|nr:MULTISPECIES: helix-turn-helix domain-containing protein [unclassified Xanthobacter]